MVLGLLLWTLDDSELPTGPLTISLSRLFKPLSDNVLLEHGTPSY